MRDMSNILQSFNRHISLNTNMDILQLCNAFFKDKKLKINHLNYIQKNDDGTVFYLCSNHNWLSHYFRNCYSSIGAFEQRPDLSNYKYVLWDNLDSGDKILLDSKEILGIEHGITIIDRIENGYGYYNLGTNLHQPMMVSNYINYLDDLNHFVQYFKDQAASLLLRAEQTRFILPRERGQKLKTFTNKHWTTSKIKSKDRKLYIDRNNNLFLTAREIECIEWYAKGKSSGEISLILGISRRTVETHMENSKIKLNCTNMFQLGYSIAMIKKLNYGYIPLLQIPHNY